MFHCCRKTGGRRGFGGSELNLNLNVVEQRVVVASNRTAVSSSIRGSAPDVRKQGGSRRSKSTPVSRQVCEKATSDLCHVAKNVVQLYKKVANDQSMPESERRAMLQCLGQAAAKAQDDLRPVVSGFLGDGGGALVASQPHMMAPVGSSPAFPMPGNEKNNITSCYTQNSLVLIKKRPEKS